MSSPRRFHFFTALGSFTVTAVAGWFSVKPPATDAARVIPAMLEKSAPPVSQPADRSASAVLAAAERELMQEFDRSGERFTGERLAELCLADSADTAGEDDATRYARGWAAQSPQEMYDWFQSRGDLVLPTNTKRSDFRRFTEILFTEWAKHDSTAAVKAALTCQPAVHRTYAMRSIIGTLRQTDLPRAVALMAEHGEFFREGGLPFSVRDENYRAVWDALTHLPAGKTRSTFVARFFDDLWTVRRDESVRMWQEMPPALREELAAASFSGSVITMSGTRAPQYIPELEGMEEMRRRHVETTGDPVAAAHYVASRNGREWAQRDPAAAVAWAQQYLNGEQRVKGTARLFAAGAAENFDATLQLWQSLPDGVLRARAAGNLAAGAPADRKAEVEALIARFSPTDQRIADLARGAAESDEIQRVKREGLLETIREMEARRREAQ
jgi:hypothetical protein